MKFLCGSCRTKYQISDEKVRGKILTIRCKKCGAKILVRESLGQNASDRTTIAPVAADDTDGPSATRSGGSAASAAYAPEVEGSRSDPSDGKPTSVAPVPINTDLAGYEWFVAIDGQQHGPFAYAELVHKVQQREVLGRHYVWHDGMENWTRVRSLPDLHHHITSTAAPEEAPPAPSGVDPSTVRSGSMGSVLDFASARGTADIDDTPSSVPRDAGPSAKEGAGTSGPSSRSGFKASETVNVLYEGQDIEYGEDIFANVPRASAKEVVAGESTKFFVAAAGVPDAAKKIRFWIVLGAAMLSTLLVLMGLWVTGVLKVSLPGIGNPFAATKETTAVTHATSGLDDDGNYALLVEGVRIEPVKPRRGSGQRGSRKQGVLDNLGQAGYIDDRGGGKGTRDRRASAVSDLKSVSIDGPDTKLRAPDKLTRFDGPDTDLTVPPPDGAALDAVTIQKVVASKKASVRMCYEQSLKAREKLQGKLRLRIEVRPTGKVSRTQIVSPSFKGSVVGKCIRRNIRNWRFPQFSGGPQEIELPFIFQRGGY